MQNMLRWHSDVVISFWNFGRVISLFY